LTFDNFPLYLLLSFNREAK